MADQGLEPSAYGVVIAVNGVVIVGFQLLVNKLTDKRSPVLLLTLSSLLFALGTGATALAGTPVVFAATVVVWTIGEMIHVPTNAAATARLAPEHARGRYQGVMGMSWSIGGFVAPIAAGWIVEGPGPDVLWIASGVIGCVAAVGYTTLLHKALSEDEEEDESTWTGSASPADTEAEAAVAVDAEAAAPVAVVAVVAEAKDPARA
jgi:MFS family permease